MKGGHGGMHLSSQQWQKPKIGGSQSRLVWAKVRDPISKITRAKRAGSVTQTAEQLPSQFKALSSNPSSAKKKKRRKRTKRTKTRMK
jgi:hypothetical protein